MKPTSSVEDPNIAYLPNPHGVNIPVRYYGHEAHGTPVLMIHGLQSHSGWFTQSANFISSLGLPVYAIDRHGSGLSKAPRGATRDFREFIHDVDVAALYAMKTHRKKQVHIIGHCLGSIGAVAYACLRPHSTKSLILTSPGLYTKVQPKLAHKFKIIWSRLTGLETRVPVPLEPWMFSELDEYVSFIKKDSLSLTSVTGRFCFEVYRSRAFVKKHLLNLTMPVWVACAGDDPIVHNEKNKLFLEKLPAQKKKYSLYAAARHILEFSSEKNNFFTDLSQWFRELGESNHAQNPSL